MFNDIKTKSSQRITEIREYLNFVSNLISPPPSTTPRNLKTGKGLIFVQLYGVIEYTVTATIAKCIFYINNDAVKLSDLKPIILGLALNPDLDALIQVTSKKWDKRYDFFYKVEQDNVVYINDDIMPTDGKNIYFEQLESIWKTFCLTDPIFHDTQFRGRLQEIVSNRINITHGTQSAADIGGRVTIQELNNRLNEVSAFCSYFIAVFEDYVINKKFKK